MTERPSKNRNLIRDAQQGAKSRSRTRPSMRFVGLLALASCVSSCSSGQPNALPNALFGTWTGGNNLVHSVRFSEGGRLEINDSSCSGEYQLSAVDGNLGTVSSGYMDCGSIMNGYLTSNVTVTGNTLTITGAIINGTYTRR